jgi:hypothetical protein
MKNCTYCGTQIDDSVVFCPSCGANQSANTATQTGPEIKAAAMGASSTGDKYVGWTILGFLIPIVALILYLMWKDTEPSKALAVGKGGLMSISVSYPIAGLIIYLLWKDKYQDIAKACGICGIIGFALGVVTFIFSFVVGIILGLSGEAYAVMALPILI